MEGFNPIQMALNILSPKDPMTVGAGIASPLPKYSQSDDNVVNQLKKVVPAAQSMNDDVLHGLWQKYGFNLFPKQQAQITPAPAQIPNVVQQALGQMFGGAQKAPQGVLGAQTQQNGATPDPSIKPNITIPYSQGGKMTLPANLAQVILNAFNQTGQATNAAQVLNHPLSQTYSPEEIEQFGHASNNYGENASFQTVKDATNDNGSIDRGLFRINSDTFKGYMSNPVSKAILKSQGITSYADMNDPQKNTNFAALLQSNRGWQPWFAAPLNLRYPASGK